MKKTSIVLVLVMVISFFAGCNNSKSNEVQDADELVNQIETSGNELYSDETTSETDVYDTLDLSMYDEWGEFGEDGLMWVIKNDYKGKQISYMNTKGEIVFTLPEGSSIDTYYPQIAGDFRNGLAIFYYELDPMNNGIAGIINTSGEVIAKFDRCAMTQISYLSNGNIFFNYVGMNEGHEYTETEKETYMFVKKSADFVSMPFPAKNSIETIDYSDGLMFIYCDFMVETKGYYDSNGRCVIDLTENEEYWISGASPFEDGKATLTFIGDDDNYYNVEINKKGEWISEPVSVSEDERLYLY